MNRQLVKVLTTKPSERPSAGRAHCSVYSAAFKTTFPSSCWSSVRCIQGKHGIHRLVDENWVISSLPAFASPDEHYPCQTQGVEGSNLIKQLIGT